MLFGSDVLIFSDKHCRFRVDADPALAWRRWYQRAVLDSVRQLNGAERWIKEQPSRMFLDSQCKERLPLPLPANPRFHRIVTCRGIAEASRQAWGGRGSLFVTNARLDACLDTPFQLGALDEQRRMFHVLDEVALDAVLATEDTVSDFCSYLRRKENLFATRESVVASSEEDLLALYLKGSATGEAAHDFDAPADADIIVVDDSHWNWWLESKQFKAKAVANRISYCWDRLIEKFAFHITTDTQHFSSGGGVSAQEVMLRWMARESRVRRRMIAETLIDAMSNTAVGQMRRRYLKPSYPGDPFWLFLILPRTSNREYERYREERRMLLQALCMIIKHLHPEALDIGGVAAEPQAGEISEDLLYMDCRNWSDEMAASAKKLYDDTGFFSRAERKESVEWEFPISLDAEDAAR